MISKNTIKFVRSLTLKKYRNLNAKFIVEGPKIVPEIANSDLVITDLFALQYWIDNNSTIADKAKSVQIITEDELSKISSLTTPNQVLAIAEIPQRNFLMDNAETSIVIALDDIRDPGNLGTTIRIADWFGIKHIVCSMDCVDAYNPKTVQASMGSISRVNVYYENLADLMQKTSGKMQIYGAFLEGDPIFKISFAENGFLVIGNEANGISPEIEKLITQKISIPTGNPTGLHAESLNASIATAVICSEIIRQKAY